MVATFEESGTEEKREKFIFAVVRGDMDYNDTKLASAALGCTLRSIITAFCILSSPSLAVRWEFAFRVAEFSLSGVLSQFSIRLQMF